MKIEAIIFDMDGVLVDTEPLQLESFKIFLAEYDVVPDEAFLNSLVGHSVESNLHLVNEVYLSQQPLPVGESIKRREKVYLRLLHKSKLEPLPGIEPLLAECKHRNMKLGLASSSSRIQVKTILDLLTMRPHSHIDFNQIFTSVITGSDVKNKKPAPDIYQQAMSDLSVHKEKIIAIEDSYAGYQSATAAGVQCLVLNNRYITAEELKRVDTVIERVEDVLKAIRN